MGYFKHFPYIEDYQIQDQEQAGQDLTKRTGVELSSRLDPNAHQEYIVKNGESPHVLADRAYDDAQLYWVILVYNNIIDPISEWPMDQYSLETYIKKKYQNPDGIHHYVAASTGMVVDADYVDYDRVPVTNREYEIRLNDQKAHIKVPLPECAEQIRQQHKRLIGV